MDGNKQTPFKDCSIDACIVQQSSTTSSPLGPSSPTSGCEGKYLFVGAFYFGDTLGLIVIVIQRMMLYHHGVIMEDVVVTVCMYGVVLMLRDVVEKFQMMILITMILFDIPESA